jgi:hypothetical protein
MHVPIKDKENNSIHDKKKKMKLSTTKRKNNEDYLWSN